MGGQGRPSPPYSRTQGMQRNVQNPNQFQQQQRMRRKSAVTSIGGSPTKATDESESIPQSTAPLFQYATDLEIVM